MSITQFDTGAVRDSQGGKPDFVETQSMLAEWRFANYMTGKKKKYGEGNFKKGIPKSSYLQSTYRHLVKLLALEDCEKYGIPVQDWMEPNEDHASAIRFNVNGYMHEEEKEGKKTGAEKKEEIKRSPVGNFKLPA
jgi:hypothetical protein